MATYSKINDFVLHLAHGVHNFNTSGGHSLLVALSNTAPASETPIPYADGNGVLANVTEIVYTNLSSRAITKNSSTQTSGTYTLALADTVLNATGAVATFRYVYVYNDTPTSPADPLICHFDYGQALTLANGESLTIDWCAGTQTLFTLA